MTKADRQERCGRNKRWLAATLVIVVLVIWLLGGAGPANRQDGPGWYEWDGPLNWPLPPSVQTTAVPSAWDGALCWLDGRGQIICVRDVGGVLLFDCQRCGTVEVILR